MKKIACVFLIIFIGFSLAGAAELPNIYVYTGLTRPIAPADFKDTYRTGVNVGIAVGKTLTNFLECDLHFSYHGSTFDVNSFRNTLDPETAELFVVDGGPTHMLSTMFRAKLLMPSPEASAMRSYFYAGAGMVIKNTNDITVLGPEVDGSQDFIVPGSKETVPGLCGGLGFEYHVETTTLFLELGLISGFTAGEATIVLPLKFGIAIK